MQNILASFTRECDNSPRLMRTHVWAGLTSPARYCCYDHTKNEELKISFQRNSNSHNQPSSEELIYYR
jgi:hypothetical protein